MATTCTHGFAPDACLICRTLGTSDSVATVTTTAPARSVAGRAGSAQPLQGVARPDAVYQPAPKDRGQRRGLGGTLLLIVMALLAIGAAVWILAGVVFTILHVLELVAVAAGSGWVGYKIGHFRGSRHPRHRA